MARNRMTVDPRGSPEFPTGVIDGQASTSAKIALFRSLFRGREDVYARRFESRKSGKSGYQPDCANEWIKGVCEKPRVRCTECLHQRFRPVTDAAIRSHLLGRDESGAPFVMGAYPMLQDETCFFLAVDFDKKSWGEDARAFLETCHSLGDIRFVGTASRLPSTYRDNGTPARAWPWVL
jgi:hypothetical protein